MANDLIKLVKLFPNKPWDWVEVFNNPGIKLNDDAVDELAKIALTELKNSSFSCGRRQNFLKFIINKVKISTVAEFFDDYYEWKYLSLHPDLTWPFIVENFNKGWDWSVISARKFITWDIVQEYLVWNQANFSGNSFPHYSHDFKRQAFRPWDFAGLSKNPNLDWKIISNNLDKPWDWYEISKLSFITLEVAISHIRAGWIWASIGQRSSLADVKFAIIKLKSLNDNSNFNNTLPYSNKISDIIRSILVGFVQGPEMSYQILIDNLDLEWPYGEVSRHAKLINWDFVFKNPDKKWSWYYLSINKTLTWQLIKDNLEQKWDWRELSKMEFLTDDFIESNSNLPWDWTELAQHKHLTWNMFSKFVHRFEKGSSFWWHLTYNRNITRQIILDNPQLFWDRDSFSYKEKVGNNNKEEDPQILFRQRLNSLSQPLNDEDFKWALSHEQWNEWNTEIIASSFTESRCEMLTPDEVLMESLVNNPAIGNKFYLSRCRGIRPSENASRYNDDNRDYDLGMVESHIDDYLRLKRFINTNLYSSHTYVPHIHQLPLSHQLPEKCVIEMSCNPNLTWKTVANNPNLYWSWLALSRNQFFHTPKCARRSYYEVLEPILTSELAHLVYEYL